MMEDQATIEDIKKKMAQSQKENRTPQEKYDDFWKEAQELLRTTLERFHLRIYHIGGTECIVYQGTMTNVWARFSVREKIFYRTVLERQFEKADLIKKSNEIVYRR